MPLRKAEPFQQLYTATNDDLAVMVRLRTAIPDNAIGTPSASPRTTIARVLKPLCPLTTNDGRGGQRP